MAAYNIFLYITKYKPYISIYLANINKQLNLLQWLCQSCSHFFLFPHLALPLGHDSDVGGMPLVVLVICHQRPGAVAVPVAPSPAGGVHI